ncbi:MAG: Replication factor A protein 1 [Sclerophora amabilis]|nr:MAG: Replication factor A protein 1 [Sclerophora amabilis]
MAGDAASHITQGSLSAIFNSADNAEAAAQQPVVQCVQIKPLASQQQGGPERFRVVFSDIRNYVQSMLATRKSLGSPTIVHDKFNLSFVQLNNEVYLSEANWVIHDGKLQKGCFVRLKSFQANSLKGKKILIVLDLEVIEQLGTCEKIGVPVSLEAKDEEDTKPQPTAISSSGFYGNKTGQPQQVQSGRVQSLPSRTNGVGPPSSAHANIYPIEALSPYAHKWTIKARCTQKGEIKHWHNAKGEGKLFSVNLLDESGEIRATGFNEQCDMLYELFQENQVYYISCPCKVQLAKKQFTNLNNDYELTFERDTHVEKAEDPDSVPQVRFNFTSVGDLQNVEPGTTIDTIGVLKEVGDVSQITSKTTSKPYDKRELSLVDNTGFSVRLTVWGSTATSFDAPEDSVIAFKGVKVSDFGGRSLSLLHSGSMTLDPDIDEAHKLKGWYDAQGRSDNFSSHQSMAGAGTAGGRNDQTKTIAQVRDENIGMSENNEFFSLKATIIYIQKELSYPACPSERCNKKVVEDESEPGKWRCEKCNKTYDGPEHRYMMSINVCDHTGQLRLSGFDDAGRILMGTDANKFLEMRENDDQAAVKTLQDANCRTWVFRVRAKTENFRDEQRVRYSISSVQPLNFSNEAAKLAEVIKLYNID